MSGPHDPRVLALVARALRRPGAPFREAPARLVVVDDELQRLHLLENGTVTATYPVSTAAAGLCGAEGSLGTPPGWHRIQARLGAGQPMGAVFESREPTGRVWRGEATPDDLILTRVLTLEGMEDGVNRGAGCDTLVRYVYLHGTNHEAALGRRVSHGCIRLANADVAALFERVREGDAVVVAGEMPDPFGGERFHYAGLGGSGMSALAQYHAMRAGRVSGSDRAFDRGERTGARAQLERLGIGVLPQDGSGLAPLAGESHCGALVVSTAVEEQVPDVAAARERGVPVLHRSDLLARFVAERRTVAVTGTSGKSTTAALIFEVLRGAGRDPSVIAGGELVSLQCAGLWGNAWAGSSDLLVIEADESDGSLVRYEPAVGVILNLQRDHKEMADVAALFDAFCQHVREVLVVGDAENLAPFAEGAVVFGTGPRATVRAAAITPQPGGVHFHVDGVAIELSLPGLHNVENALAAMAACHALGVPLAAMAAPLAAFQGVARRFQVIGASRGVEVVDDFAHNASKIRAALAAAQARSPRVLAVYQPHGYGPTRFLRADLVAAFREGLRAEDRVWWLDVFYAGGTATRDVSSAEIAAEIAAAGGPDAEHAPSRDWLVERLAVLAAPGDLILVMGARDPSLTDLAQRILRALAG